MRKVAKLGDSSSHGGSITSSNTDHRTFVEGAEICVKGAILSCPIHGNQPIIGNLDNDWYVNGKKVVLDGSTAACGASIIASCKKTYGS